MEQEKFEKIYYCRAGGAQYVVFSKYIVNRDAYFKTDGRLIQAKKAYAIEFMPTQVAGPRGSVGVNVQISIYKNVKLWVDIIADIDTASELYSKIIELDKAQDVRDNN